MHIPHLRAAGPQHLAARLFPAFHQPGVRGKLLDPIESLDVMDFVEDGERQHFPNAGHGSQAVKRIAVMPFRVAHERQLEVVDQAVVALKERQIDFDALADTRVGKMVGHAIAIGRVRQPALEFRQVVLRARVLNVRQPLSALAHQVQPSAE